MTQAQEAIVLLLAGGAGKRAAGQFHYLSTRFMQLRLYSAAFGV